MNRLCICKQRFAISACRLRIETLYIDSYISYLNLFRRLALWQKPFLKGPPLKTYIQYSVNIKHHQNIKNHDLKACSQLYNMYYKKS